MRVVSIPGIDQASLKDAVGPAAFSRGSTYAKKGAVVHMAWDPGAHVLHGTVRGQYGDDYETAVYFDPGPGGVLSVQAGECDCPVGYDCKHVAALALRAMVVEERKPRAAPKADEWLRQLDAVLDDPARPSGDDPLAIQLVLAGPPTSTGSGPALSARLVRPGRTGWVGAGLGWNNLEGANRQGGFDRSHISLLRELHALYQARSGGHYAYYAYHDEKAIDLAAIDSRHLWSVLDEARKIGVRLLHRKKQLGELAEHSSLGVRFDVVQVRNLTVTPVLHVDGVPADVAPVRFIGADGHGLVHVSRADAAQPQAYADWRLGLARLDNPVPAPIRAMLLAGRGLKIPAAGVARFRDEYYPRLRGVAPLVSSDGSFTPPEISGPTLTLNASYGDGHELRLDWAWTYQVGGSRLSTRLGDTPANAGYRDADRERAILDGLGEVGAPEAATLHGVDTMRFTTEVLPLLEDRPGVEVAITGAAADYREAGDSMRIGVSTGGIAGQTDWFDLGVSITVEGVEVPFVDVFTALDAGLTHLLLPDGAYFSLDRPELAALRRLIEEARALQDGPGGPLRISRFQVGLWDELAALGVVDRQAKAWREQVRGLLSVDSLDTTEVPSTLAAHLRPYQLTGFRWLAFLWRHRLGGILADDMGLGKTLQVLALVCHAREVDPDGPPFLVVAPTSVLSNWAAEAARFAPGLEVVVITDTLRRSGQDLAATIAAADVVVTSYTLFRLDFEAHAQQRWAALVLDEAQFAKNHQSKVHQCARALDAPVKFAVTGTPMENNLMELWSLLSITAPGLFPSPARFQDFYARPVEKGGDTERLALLRRRIKPLMRRRTKEQVAADLPAKQEQVLEVELHPRHRRIYQTHLQRERRKVLGLVDDLGKHRFAILKSLVALRQLSLHAGLVDDAHLDLPSAKVEALTEQLGDVVEGGHRCLVFSQFTGFLKIVRDRLDATGVEYCYLDGSTRNRAAVLKRFKEGSAPVFLISLKAGGFGLNLTEADYCFLLDPWWNPATEAQAVDRTHRIGQTRAVMVYRFIAKDTIEEKVMALKARKAELFSGLMDDGEAFGSTLDADDIRALFD
ncbi:DEAD/DEAH box helicase [Umezawaea sp. Da 62-37]|uniref:DEAD/DEAH box helicase n=1 Tax=Umezawaea sp. Da 62-37 TaxID=3075927 RepID=UPI0028F72344|nr:DEAD/DEAH box helicase [Umezawaea sp. Da 62-37]WNV83683.1 DEAD/DEAH box helicase [Umezawaea sp. Da 62-37]